MQNNKVKVLSPERSRSIKIKIPSKIFPQDFFRRSASQTPPKQRKNRYDNQELSTKASSDIRNRNQVYWQIMHQQLEKCKPNSKMERSRPFKRIWVYSEKKNREKGNQQNIEDPIEKKINKNLQQEINNIESPNGKDKKSKYLQEAMFTFFEKCPMKANIISNVQLPPIRMN